MSRYVRYAAAVVVALLLGVLAASPSVAGDHSPSPSASASASATAPSPSATDPAFGCLGATTTYGAPLPCQLNVTVAQPVCDGDVPYLKYAVEAVGSPNTTVTITWVNPSGADVVYANQPLSGRVLWPGAVVDSAGKPVDWPGWHKTADGAWVQGDEFDWVRPSVQVHFKVNPEATVAVAYPASSPQCSVNPQAFVLADSPTDPSAAVLAATGSNGVGPTLLGAAGLVVVGALVVTLTVVARRRRRSA
jgi:hypothetical protein